MSERDDSNPKLDIPTEAKVLEQRLYDPAAGPDLTTVIVEAVAAVEGVDAMQIKEPLLYEVVDIAAVKDALFGTGSTSARGVASGSLGFEYRGFDVTVHSDGWVQIAERTDR